MRLRQDSQGHARLIESAVKGRGASSDIGQAVRHSWSRCLSTYSLDPLQIKQPLIVQRADLEARRERIDAELFTLDGRTIRFDQVVEVLPA